jgi:hypothetical protein
VAEGLTAAEVGKEIGEHRRHTAHTAERHELLLSITEAVLLSVVALLAAWSGYSAAKWSTESSLTLSKASATRAEANRASIEALQIRTLDSVSFNAGLTAFESHDTAAFRLALRRMRPGYRPAVNAWLALHPLKNPATPPDPSYMPQYRIPQEAQARALDARAERTSAAARAAGATADKYVRLTVFLASVLFLVGISSHFPVRSARYGLIAAGAVLLVFSVIQLLGLPGPPA